jgi:hypothetical protein
VLAVNGLIEGLQKHLRHCVSAALLSNGIGAKPLVVFCAVAAQNRTDSIGIRIFEIVKIIEDDTFYGLKITHGLIGHLIRRSLGSNSDNIFESRTRFIIAQQLSFEAARSYTLFGLP